jgi:4-diphosphocytidyl-2C-methyl-D-erythritol kinase
MSGSGSSVFGLFKDIPENLIQNFLIVFIGIIQINKKAV